MGVNSLPMPVTRQRCGCDLNPGPTARESSTLTTRLPSHRAIHRGKRSLRETGLARRSNVDRRKYCQLSSTDDGR